MGPAVAIVGIPGIGKTSIVDEAVSLARRGGYRVLRTRGRLAENRMPFVGLYELLGDQLGNLAHVPTRRRQALRGAFGLAQQAFPDIFLVSLAVLDLLTDATTTSVQGALLAVEDTHWLDDETAQVLAFVLRHGGPGAPRLLVSARSGRGGPLVDEITQKLELEPLQDDDARALLARAAPHLDESSKRQVLEAAGGVPLALLELPRSARSDDLDDTLPGTPAPTERLMQAFATRALGLPDVVRQALLVAAVNDSGSLSEVLVATSTMVGVPVDAVDLVPAESAGVIETVGAEVRFRHPLWQAVVRREASGAARHSAHAALAKALTGAPERRAWHLAAATTTPDPALAAEFERLAETARARGALSVALAAQGQAVRLSDDPQERAQRVVRAVELAHLRGDRKALELLVADAVSLDLADSERSYLMYLRDLFHFAPWTSSDLLEDTANARRAGEAGDTGLALKLLDTVTRRFWFAGISYEVLDEVDSVLSDLAMDIEDPAVARVAAWSNPTKWAPAVLERLERGIASTTDPWALADLGTAAFGIGACHLQLAALDRAVRGLRERQSFGSMMDALMLEAAAAFLTGDWRASVQAAEEGAALARRTGQAVPEVACTVIAANCAAVTGDVARCRALLEGVTGTRPGFPATMLGHSRALLALAGDEPDEAFERFASLFVVGHPMFNRRYQTMSIVNLAESAVRVGRGAEALVLLEEWRRAPNVTSMPLVHIELLLALALLEPGDGRDLLLEVAARAGDWPFQRARAALAAGTGADGRTRGPEVRRRALRSARDEFDRLGAVPWSARAREGLNALTSSAPRTPQSSSVGHSDVARLLGPRELEVASLVGAGLSNREIGARLYLSPRTVSTYLYKIFPKLGVTSRVQLALMLSNAPAPAGPDVHPGAPG